MSWETAVLIPLSTLAFGLAGYRLTVLIRLLKAHQPDQRRTQQLLPRFTGMLDVVFGQKTVLKKFGPGLMHVALFWGFLVLSIGTLEQYLTTIYRPLHFQVVGKSLYLIFAFSQDFFAFAVLLAVAYATFRRHVLRPEGLGKSRDADIILSLIFFLMLSILIMNSFRLLGEDAWLRDAMPLSAILSGQLNRFAFSATTIELGRTVFKWVHLLLILAFAVYIPGSKHLHILAAGFNVFFRNLGISKAPKAIHFSENPQDQVGAEKITDLSQKDILDLYSCTECGRCQDLCPAHNTQKPLSPKMLILDLKANLFRNQRKILAGKKNEVTPIIDNEITEETIWSCTSCRACETACPVSIEHTDKILDVRRDLVMMKGRVPTEVQNVFKNLETYGSPWPFPPEARTQWAEGLQIKTIAQEPKAELLLWVGCAGAFDERYKKVVRALASCLKKAGIKFAILGEEERCTGDPARKLGNEYLFQELARRNIELLKQHQVQKIITACPHCFNTVKNEYPALGGNFEVFHHTQYLAKLITEGKLKPAKGSDETITYHDSCYLGRWNGIYEEPRAILRSLPSVRMIEMENTKDQSTCCGAGGGRFWMEEKLGKRINRVRTEQATATKAGIIASACPFCISMFEEGIKAKNMENKIKVKDIAELVDLSSS